MSHKNKIDTTSIYLDAEALHNVEIIQLHLNGKGEPDNRSAATRYGLELAVKCLRESVKNSRTSKNSGRKR